MIEKLKNILLLFRCIKNRYKRIYARDYYGVFRGKNNHLYKELG